MRGFAPPAEELARARRIVELYDAALARGDGAAVDEQGRMVDEAIAKAARKLLAEA
jgi:citrate lyase subunit beta/citryl-CoA lyase